MRGSALASAVVGSFAVVGKANVTEVLNWGNPQCPCLTKDEIRNDVLLEWPAAGYRNVSDARLQSYGLGCGHHDSTAPPLFQDCASSVPPAFCNAAWCYVDYRRCDLQHDVSTIFMGQFYSYATCSFLDNFNSNYVHSALQGKTLRIVQLHNTGGWKGSYCTRRNHCSGPVAQIFDSILSDAGAFKNATITFLGGPLANYPDAYPDEVMDQVLRDNPNQRSTFTACSYAAGMGYVDICVGAFTMNLQRKMLSSMITLWQEPVYLVTAASQGDVSLWDRIFLTFRPFTPAAWATIILFIMFVSCMVGALEYFRGERLVSVQSIGAVRRRSFAGHLVFATYQGLQSFVNGGSAMAPRQPGSQFMNLGLGFLLMITVTSYTANLATQLIVKSEPTTAIGGIRDIIRNPSYRVCALYTFKSTLQFNLKLPEQQIATFLSRSDVLPAVGTDVCIAAVITLEDFDAARKYGEFCNLTRVGDPLYYMTWGSSVSDKVFRTLSLFYTKAEMAGEHQEILDRFRERDECSSSSSANDDVGMEVASFLGPIMISTVLVLCGFCAQTMWRQPQSMGQEEKSRPVSHDSISPRSSDGADSALMSHDNRANVPTDQTGSDSCIVVAVEYADEGKGHVQSKKRRLTACSTPSMDSQDMFVAADHDHFKLVPKRTTLRAATESAGQTCAGVANAMA